MARRNIDIEIKKIFAIHALKWCKKNLGVNKRKSPPKISVRIRFMDESDKYDAAAYISYSNKIIIYHINCNSLYDVVSAVIHEYTHYLQSWRKYWKYFETHYYSTHPYEKQARKNEEKYTKKCLRNIKKTMDSY